MADKGFITWKEADEAVASRIGLNLAGTEVTSVAPYFLEEVRKELEGRSGAKVLYQNGLTVQPALDLTLQDAANRALDEGIRRIDPLNGSRKPRRNVTDERQRVEGFKHACWDRPLAVNDIVPAVVAAVDAAAIHLRAGAYRVTVDKKGFAWTRKTVPSQLVRVGDLVETKLLTLAPVARTATGALDQPPLVEGAVLAIDNRTGQITTMVGGYSFERSKVNRATQALRPVGSAFKPFVYTTAIDRGYTPTTILQDSPVTYPGGPGQPPYSPQNYEKDFWGPVTMRRALEHSRNVPAIKLMDALGP